MEVRWIQGMGKEKQFNRSKGNIGEPGRLFLRKVRTRPARDRWASTSQPGHGKHPNHSLTLSKYSNDVFTVNSRSFVIALAVFQAHISSVCMNLLCMSIKHLPHRCSFYKIGL